MKYKTFDNDLYNQSDQRGKEAAIKVLSQCLPCVLDPVETANRYGVDLTIVDWNNDPYCYVEVEIRNAWKSRKFPFDCLYIPRRKDKFTKLDKRTIFIVFNNNVTDFVACEGIELNRAVLKENPNKYVEKGEFFYKIPLTSFHYNSVSELITKEE
mgnify:CR=1 FL=1